MDNQLELTTQAFSKMVMHAMKHPQSVCCGLLLSKKPIVNQKDSGQGDNDKVSDNDDDIQAPKKGETDSRIVDAIPISHASHYLTPNIETALNAVGVYAQEHGLVISGYYQADKFNQPGSIDTFGQKVTEKIADSYPNAVLCSVNFDGPMAQPILELHQFIDGKWHRRPAQSYQVEEDPDVIAETILYTEDKLYRKIIDFDDHFNNISLDWTNAKIAQRIDYLVANIA